MQQTQNALFRLGFPPAPVLLYLNLAYYINSQAHSTKGTPSPHKEALTACRSTVSGSISLPSRGAFHLSLTVLFAIGSYLVFSLGGWAPQIQTGLLVSRLTQEHASLHRISHTGLSPSSVGLPSTVPLSSANALCMPYNPISTEMNMVWANPRSLAATKGISIDFFSFRYLDGSVP